MRQLAAERLAPPPVTSPPAETAAADVDGMLAGLKRIATRQIERAEADALAANAPLDDREVKLATALAALVGKIRELEINPRGRRAGSDETDAATAPEPGLEQSLLEALEAFVDGRAAGLARAAE